MKIFNDLQKKKADFIIKNKYAKLSELNSSEIKNLAITWCYYSGKIEGNTYTYVETDALLTDGITSTKKYEDAKMLKNLYNTFIGELEYINKEQNKEVINERTLFRIHSSISSGLVDTSEAGQLRKRGVRVTGTTYVPPKETQAISSKLNEILFTQEGIQNVLERAVYLHCNLARLQPFIDGNKRTSRMMEGIAMMNADLIPVYSSQEKDIIQYKDALLSFYETEDYSKYADYFLDKQIERINMLSLDNEPKFDLKNGRVVSADEGLEL